MKLQIESVPISQIFPNPILRTRSDVEIESMATSLADIGQISPIGAIQAEKGLEAIYGNTRLLAAKGLQWETIEVRIYPPETTHAECLRLAVCENTVREQMNFVELADAIHEYAKLSGLSIAQAGHELNYKQSQISKCLKTDQRLTARNKKKLVEAGIGGSLAYLISQETKRQDELVDTVIGENWSRKKIEQFLRQKRKGIVRFQYQEGGGKLVLDVPRSWGNEKVMSLLKAFAGDLKRNGNFDMATAARRIKEQINVVS